MGRKVNPIGFRLGIVTDWESKWYAERNYTQQLHEDLQIRRLILNELTRAGISRIELERSANKVDVTLHTSKPGIVIGKQGANVERLRQMLDKDRQEGASPDRRDQGAGDRCQADSGEHRGANSRRVAYRRAMKHAVQQAIRRGAKGVKIPLSGRLGGAEMSRSVTEMDGRVPCSRCGRISTSGSSTRTRRTGALASKCGSTRAKSCRNGPRSPRQR